MSCHKFRSATELHTEDNRSRFTLKDSIGKGKTSYLIENVSKSNFTVIEVDSLIKTNLPQCDLLVLNCSFLNAYFVEFKGSDTDKALKQISETIDSLAFGITNYKQFNARIIQTRVHQMTTVIKTSSFAKLNKKVKLTGGTIEIKSQKFTETL